MVGETRAATINTYYSDNLARGAKTYFFFPAASPASRQRLSLESGSFEVWTEPECRLGWITQLWGAYPQFSKHLQPWVRALEGIGV